jgi:two-component system, NtrC family, sensor kinase
MESLEGKAELLDLLFAATNDGIVDWDLVGNQTRYNDRWRFLLGWDEEGFVLTPNTWRELIHENERPAVEEAIADHFESGWPFVQVVRMRHRSQGWRWILVRGTSRKNTQGQPCRMVILFADIDERVRAEAQAHALVEAIPDTILSVRSDGTVLAAKEGTRSKGAAPRSGAAHALFAAIQASEAGSRVMECIETAGKREEVAQIPCRLHQAAAEPTDYEIRIVGSGVDQAVCIVRDVTRERSNEEQLARGRKLEAIGQLAAGLAHEINTPLQYIGDNIEFAKEAIPSLLSLIDDFHKFAAERLPKDAAEAIARKEQEIDLSFLRESLAPSLSRGLEGLAHIARIVQAMKTFETASCQERVRVDLNPILENAAIVATRAWSQFVELSVHLGEHQPAVPCIPGEIAQTVMNLVTNAAQAVAEKVGSSGKTGLVTLETTHRQADEQVEIRVSDDGNGIPEAIRGRIFDPFFTTRPPGQGSGQGLAQVHGAVVRLHGGSVSFDSVEGKGTTFVVRLPLRDHAADATAPDR